MLVVVHGMVLPMRPTEKGWQPGDQEFLAKVFRENDTRGNDGSASK